MKELRAYIKKWADWLNEHWRKLSLKQQRWYILCFFMGYLALTVTVLIKIGMDLGAPGKAIIIKHIENPILKQKAGPVPNEDSISIILKNNNNDRNQ